MYLSNFFGKYIVAPALMVVLAVGTAMADRDGGDRGRGGGGGGGGGDRSSRSFSGGGGGDRSSRSFSGGGPSRSFSGGGGERSSRSFSGGGSSRSFSGGDSSRSSRSFSGGGERASRSFSGGGERSSRSFNSGSIQSFSGGNRGDSSRSVQSRSFSRPSDSDSSRARVYTNQGGRMTTGRNDRGSTDSVQTFRSNPSSPGQSGNRSFSFGNQGRDRSSDIGRSQSGQDGARSYQARRANEEQVRNFLQMRERDGSQQSNFRSRTDGENRSGNNRAGDNVARDLDNRLQDGNRGDRSTIRGTDTDRRGDWSQRLGDANRRGDNDGRNVGDRGDRDVNRGDRDFNRGDFNRGDRDFNNRGDRDFASDKYKNWRNSWGGDRGDGRHDHRDWSGKWKDGDRFDVADRIRRDWHGRHHDHDDYPFAGKNWWGSHHHHGWDWWDDYAYRYHRPYYWWAWAAAPRLASWLTFGWSTPYYWDYGYGEYLYYDDGAMYVNGRWYQPAQVYYDNTVQLVERVPDLTPEQAGQLEWLPLGVFAVTRDGVAEPDVLVQLAVTQDGIIGGTASNQRTSASYPIEGTVDKQSQRAVWSYVNDQNQKIVMETSIYNLTQAESTGLVHYGPNDIRVIELVRLEDPSAGASTGNLPVPPVVN